MKQKPIIITPPKFINIPSGASHDKIITLYPFTIVQGDISIDIYRREYIRFVQQKELFVLFFYILFVWDFLKGMRKYKNPKVAYHRIRFTQEVKINMFRDGYVESRPKNNWKSYRV